MAKENGDKAMRPMDDPVEENPPVDTPAEGETEVVVYLGVPGVRKLTVMDWMREGVPDHEETVWDHNNKWTVRIDSLNITAEQADRIFVYANGFGRMMADVSELVGQ